MVWENDRRDASGETPEQKTRRLIDAQLQKAGWEADTKHLRYSEGARPAKGRNLAIAEWPTDAASGSRMCTRPGELNRESLKQLSLTLEREGFTLLQLNGAISQMKNQEIAADIINCIRHYAIGAELRDHEERTRGTVAKLKAAHDFTPEELRWIGRMERYLLEESALTESAFDEDGRFQAEGGFRRIDKIFGNRLKK